jgi:hypothetical protein
LALARDLRELREPSSAEEIEAFETDVLAGFVLARASAGLAGGQARAHLEGACGVPDLGDAVHDDCGREHGQRHAGTREPALQGEQRHARQEQHAGAGTGRRTRHPGSAG